LLYFLTKKKKRKKTRKEEKKKSKGFCYVVISSCAEFCEVDQTTIKVDQALYRSSDLRTLEALPGKDE